MNLFFDEESQKLLVVAKKEMYELKHPYVGSEHLLLAILKNRELDITRLLEDFSINYDNFRDELIKVIGVGTKCNEWFLFTPLLKRIINNATYSSKEDNKSVSPYNLFISILREGDGIANRILLGMNIDLELLYDKFVSNYSANKYVSKKLLLDDFAINMNKECLNQKYDPVVGRDKQIERVIQILLRKNKNNPILIGEAGVGKTAIVEELSRKVCLGDVPLKLKNKIIYNVSMSGLISGTKYRGEFEERFNKIIKEIKSNSNIILFIDEIHTLVGAGGAEGAIDASNILKPYLARGDIKVIGATTLDEYAKFIEKDKALERRFQKVYVEEATIDEVRDIIYKLKPVYEDFHGVSFNDGMIELLLKLSDKYVVRGRQPDKTIDFLDEVCCYAAVNNNQNDQLIINYECRINNIETEKNNEILKRNFKKAMQLRQKEYELKDEYNKALMSNNFVFNKILINEDDLYQVLYNKTSIPINKVFDRKIASLNTKLSKTIYGQDKAINDLISCLKGMSYVTNNVLNNCLLVGKRGVGKTFLIEETVKEMFGSNSFIKLDMKDYDLRTSMSKIVGAAPGYVGYDDKSSFFDKLLKKPFSVVVLENFNCASKKLIDLFRKGFSDGYFTSANGEVINIGNCLFFMTYDLVDSNLGFLDSGSKKSNSFINSFNNVIYFSDIEDKHIKKYLNSKVKKYGFDNREDINKLINKIIAESDYQKSGFERVDHLFDKYFLMMDVKS